jgi:thiamine biosynthesis lipoprotein ApbE
MITAMPRRGAHIVDPHTHRPATAVRAVTVVDGLDGYEALLVSTSGLVQVTAGWSSVERGPVG